MLMVPQYRTESPKGLGKANKMALEFHKMIKTIQNWPYKSKRRTETKNWQENQNRVNIKEIMKETQDGTDQSMEIIPNRVDKSADIVAGPHAGVTCWILCILVAPRDSACVPYS